MVTLLYIGPQWVGSNSLQRVQAFQRIEGVKTIELDSGWRVGAPQSLLYRIFWKLRFPLDRYNENSSVIRAVEKHKPDIVVVDNSKVIRRSTLKQLRRLGVARIVYYSPDDIVATHNLSLQLKNSFPEWDIVCTTKSFNVSELAALGVRHPFLIREGYDPDLHLPWSSERVGTDFEIFDAVFIGTFEKERCASINVLAEAGVSIIVYGADKGNWQKNKLHKSIELRNSVFADDYVRAWHSGKVALCFLRKINRDQITQRTMEIAAIGRPMVAERTHEHDQHFCHEKEYLGFRNDEELVVHVQVLLSDEAYRNKLGANARRRCLSSGYSTLNRAQQMLEIFIK